ncbi:MAG: MarR family winged helix-turn-helix transcriptional regulator [Chloroflexota bacterium]
MDRQSGRDSLLAEIMAIEPELHRAMGPSQARYWLGIDVTMSQLKILFVLHNGCTPGSRSGPRVGAVARSLGVTLPTVTAVMDKLVERGLVRRDEDPVDRRQHVCRLTPSGHALMDELMAGHRAHTESLLGYMSEGDLEQVLAVMRLFIEAAARMNADQAGPAAPTATPS